MLGHAGGLSIGVVAIEHGGLGPHGQLGIEKGLESKVERHVSGAEMSHGVSTIERRVVYLLVHLFVGDICLGDAELLARPRFMHFRSLSSRLDSGLETAVAAAGRGDEGALLILLVCSRLCLGAGQSALDGQEESRGSCGSIP